MNQLEITEQNEKRLSALEAEVASLKEQVGILTRKLEATQFSPEEIEKLATVETE
jgi:hypothetical protein